LVFIFDLHDKGFLPGGGAKKTTQRTCVHVFGNLVIMVTAVTLDPLALRPRLSPGLPLSDVLISMCCFKNKTDLSFFQARRCANSSLIFGGLAILVLS
jgi:hypothetical protein